MSKNKEKEPTGGQAVDVVRDETPQIKSRPVVPWFDWMPSWAQRLGFSDVGHMLSGAEIRVEEFRDDGTLVVRAELPGVDPEHDIDVTVHDGLLTIHAMRSESSRSDEKGHFQSEFRYGSFRRTVPLPAGTGAEAVSASYKDGILEVRFPVVEEQPVKRVEIARS